MIDLEHLEAVLGVPLVGHGASDVHVHRLAADADMLTTYARVQVTEQQAEEFAGLAGLQDQQDPLAAVLLLSGWHVEPNDAPAWWRDPHDLTDQRACILEPNGWIVSGYADGWWQVLAVESGPSPEPPSQ